MNKEYIEILMLRINYFEDAKISDLTNDEIKEYLALRNEIVEAMPGVKRAIKNVSEALKPYAEASKLYRERVLSKK